MSHKGLSLSPLCFCAFRISPMYHRLVSKLDKNEMCTILMKNMSTQWVQLLSLPRHIRALKSKKKKCMNILDSAWATSSLFSVSREKMKTKLFLNRFLYFLFFKRPSFNDCMMYDYTLNKIGGNYIILLYGTLVWYLLILCLLKSISIQMMTILIIWLLPFFWMIAST